MYSQFDTCFFVLCAILRDTLRRKGGLSEASRLRSAARVDTSYKLQISEYDLHLS